MSCMSGDCSSTALNLRLVWLLRFPVILSSLLSFKMSPVSNPWPFFLSLCPLHDNESRAEWIRSPEYCIGCHRAEMMNENAFTGPCLGVEFTLNYGCWQPIGTRLCFSASREIQSRKRERITFIGTGGNRWMREETQMNIYSKWQKTVKQKSVFNFCQQ